MQEIKARQQQTCKISCSFKVCSRFFEPHCMDEEFLSLVAKALVCCLECDCIEKSISY